MRKFHSIAALCGDGLRPELQALFDQLGHICSARPAIPATSRDRRSAPGSRFEEPGVLAEDVDVPPRFTGAPFALNRPNFEALNLKLLSRLREPKKAEQLHFSHQGSRNIAPTMTAEKTNNTVGMARISISQTTA